MIVNILGTNGSGKTTLVRQLMAHYGHQPLMEELNGKQYHEAHSVDGGRIMVIGPYPEGVTVGGCDKMSGYPDERGKRHMKGNMDRVEELVRKYRQQPNVEHVILEGMTTYGFARWHAVSEEFPGQYAWALLDTTLDCCIARVLGRNGGKEFKQDSLIKKYEAMHGVFAKAAAAGDLAYKIDHTRPLDNLLWILQDGGRG